MVDDQQSVCGAHRLRKLLVLEERMSTFSEASTLGGGAHRLCERCPSWSVVALPFRRLYLCGHAFRFM